MKKEVFQVLIENENCRVFALEADFGGGCKVNEYIHGGEGTAEQAVAQLGFALYRTDAMENFVEWLREYNSTAAENEQVSFYGFDMQRYDNNKEILFEYLSAVDETSRNALEECLQGLTDETVYTQEAAVNEKAAEDMQAFLSKMEEQRDEYMADKVKTIMEMEPDERIMISGHNGHIQKKSPNVSYTCMGEILAGEYKAEYYTIGTDFIEGEVNVINEAGNEQNMHIKSENDLKALLQNLEGNVFLF